MQRPTCHESVRLTWFVRVVLVHVLSKNHQTKVIISNAKPATPSNQNKHVEHDHRKTISKQFVNIPHTYLYLQVEKTYANNFHFVHCFQRKTSILKSCWSPFTRWIRVSSVEPQELNFTDFTSNHWDNIGQHWTTQQDSTDSKPQVMPGNLKTRWIR